MKYQLQQFYKITTLLLCGWFLLLANPLRADHVVGSDISWKCTTTPGVFEVTLVIYRDCQGIPLCFGGGCGSGCSQSMNLRGADPTCNNTSYGNFSLQLVSVRDAAPEIDCPNAKSICDNMGCVSPGTFTPAIERYEFKGFMNVGATSGIPATCCNVKITWEMCCRNNGINTGASWQNFYVESTINRCHSVTPCNNSPVLANDPIAFICGGEEFIFNNGATDPEFDSLTYAFTPSLQGAGNSVTYSPPFTFDKPMPWTGNATAEFPAGIRCLSDNGDIMFTPGNTSGNNFTGVMAIEIKQWKRINGVPVVLSTTRRDVQMVVLGSCPNNNSPTLRTSPPSLISPNAPRTNWQVCAGDQLCFTVTAKDTDFFPPLLSDTTKLSWNGALASLGATFEPNYPPTQDRRVLGPREDEWRFCWTPDESKASLTPYYFTVSAKDSRCPIPGRVTRAFSVKVLPKADVQIQKQDLLCNRYQFTYVRTPGKPNVTFRSRKWRISREPGDFSFAQNPYEYTNRDSTPVLTFTKGGKYLVQLEITTPGPSVGPGQQAVDCIRIFRDTIEVDTLVTAVLRDTFTCVGNTVLLTARAKHGTPSYSYFWYNGIRDTVPILNAPTFTSGALTVRPLATRYYTVRVRDLNGCASTDSVRVEVKSLPTIGLQDSVRICWGDSFRIDAGTNGGNIKRYVWNTGDTVQTITRRDSGNYIVTLTDTFNCVQRDTNRLFVNQQIIANAGSDTAICFGDTATLRPRGGQLYEWRDLSTGSVILAKTHGGVLRVRPTNTLAATQYEVQVYASYPDTTNRSLECSRRDTISVRVNELPRLRRPSAQYVCSATPQQLLPTFGVDNGQGGGVGVWSYPQAPGAIAASGSQFNTDSLKNNPGKFSNVNTDFVNWLYYRYTSPAAFGGCTVRDSAQIVINATPATDAGSRLIHCKNAGNYQITGNRVYAPTPINSAGVQGVEEWTGPGIGFTTGAGGVRRYFFNPNGSGVVDLPQVNIATFRYTKNYGSNITCINQDTVLFTVTSPPVVEAGSNIVVCKNEPLFNLTSRTGASTTPPTGASKWHITGAANAAILNNGQDFNAGSNSVVLANGSNTVQYWIVYSDSSSGCPVRDSAQLTVARVPNVDLLYDQPGDSIYVCQNSKSVYFDGWNVFPLANGQLTRQEITSDFTLSGSSAYEVNSNLAANTSRSVFNSSNAAAGNYYLRFSYTDRSTLANCSSSDSVLISVLQPPTLEVLPVTSICAYDTVSLVSINGATLAPSDIAYRWDLLGDGRYGNDTALSTTYTIGTNDRTTGTVQIRARTIARTTNLPGKLGNGTTILANGDQCAVSVSTQTLTINASPTAMVRGIDTSGCVPLTSRYSAMPTGVSGAQFRWEWENNTRPVRTDSAITEIQQEYDALVSGTYRTRLIVSSGVNPTCYDTSDWIGMYARAIPNADFITNPEITTIAKPYFDFINQSTTADNSNMSYLWNLGAGPNQEPQRDSISTEMNPTRIEYAADTAWREVKLVVTTEFGCVDSTIRRIRIDPDITVFIPNAFRPTESGDGTNDLTGSLVDCPDGDLDCNRAFKVMADGHLSIEVIVFNRWGQQVFYSTDAKEGWKGRMRVGNTNDKGELCPQDVYVYQVNATSFSNKVYKYSGSVTLLR